MTPPNGSYAAGRTAAPELTDTEERAIRAELDDLFADQTTRINRSAWEWNYQVERLLDRLAAITTRSSQ